MRNDALDSGASDTGSPMAPRVTAKLAEAGFVPSSG
jgi:hypothetical protein